jgi:hypothetical protein
VWKEVTPLTVLRLYWNKESLHDPSSVESQLNTIAKFRSQGVSHREYYPANLNLIFAVKDFHRAFSFLPNAKLLKWDKSCTTVWLCETLGNAACFYHLLSCYTCFRAVKRFIAEIMTSYFTQILRMYGNISIIESLSIKKLQKEGRYWVRSYIYSVKYIDIGNERNRILSKHWEVSE